MTVFRRISTLSLLKAVSFCRAVNRNRIAGWGAQTRLQMRVAGGSRVNRVVASGVRLVAARTFTGAAPIMRSVRGNSSGRVL